jgi:single-strand DNA-binding protein
MAQGDIPINVTGVLTAAPELRFTQSGAAVAGFTVVCQPRRMNRQTNEWEDGDATFLRCSVWRQQAEHVAESLDKGDRVIVQGLLKQRSYETAEGEKRTVFEVTVDEVGPSLKWKNASVDRVQREQGGQQRRQAPANDDPWASPPPRAGGSGGFSDEPPFAVSPSMWTLNV